MVLQITVGLVNHRVSTSPTKTVASCSVYVLALFFGAAPNPCTLECGERINIVGLQAGIAVLCCMSCFCV
jgi:hypothetical protein